MEKLPIDDDTKDWIDARSSWLLDQFGREFVRSCPIVTPQSDVLPHRLHPTEEDARTLLDHLCKHMTLDSASIDLDFYYENDRADGGETSVGVYERDGDRFRIWIEAEQLHDPPNLTATMSHELCHIHLLGHGPVTEDTDDHEPLTDLLTVFFGLGVFTANSALYDVNQRAGNWEMWRIGRRGYLTMPMFGYSLALFSRIRDEFQPTWPKHLRPDVRHAFRQSLRFLEQEGLPDLRTVRTTSNRPAFIFSDQEPQLTAQHDQSTTDFDSEHASTSCTFCDVELTENDSEGVCQECRESIEENQRELQEAEQDLQVAARHKQIVLRLGCASIVAFLLLAFVLQWLGIIE